MTKFRHSDSEVSRTTVHPEIKYKKPPFHVLYTPKSNTTNRDLLFSTICTRKGVLSLLGHRVEPQ
eukprot:3211839-Rhodomonas_salina.1